MKQFDTQILRPRFRSSPFFCSLLGNLASDNSQQGNLGSGNSLKSLQNSRRSAQTTSNALWKLQKAFSFINSFLVFLPPKSDWKIFPYKEHGSPLGTPDSLENRTRFSFYILNWARGTSETFGVKLNNRRFLKLNTTRMFSLNWGNVLLKQRCNS